MTEELSVTEFIEANLARIEQVAREASCPSASRYLADDWLTPEDHRHVEANDPTHVLAWVAAIRAVAKMHGSVNARWPRKVCGVCDEYDAWAEDRMPADWPCPTLRAIAGIWASEDGWQEGWK